MPWGGDGAATPRLLWDTGYPLKISQNRRWYCVQKKHKREWWQPLSNIFLWFLVPKEAKIWGNVTVIMRNCTIQLDGVATCSCSTKLFAQRVLSHQKSTKHWHIYALAKYSFPCRDINSEICHCLQVFARKLWCRCGCPKLTSWEEQKIISWKHHMLCYPVLSYARNCWEFDGLTWKFWWKMLVFCIFPGFNMVLERKLLVKKLIFGRINWVQSVSPRTTVEITVCSPDPVL